LIAYISGTDPDIDNRKQTSSTAIPVAFGQKIVKFGLLTTKHFLDYFSTYLKSTVCAILGTLEFLVANVTGMDQYIDNRKQI